MSSKKFPIERKKIIGDRIKAIRDHFGMAQNVFAERIESSPGFISQIENGLKMPGMDILISLKQILNVNINWLITGIGEMFETSYDTETAEVKKPPKTADSPEITHLLNAVREIFASKNESIKTALKTMVIAFHGTITNDAKIENLKGEAKERDRHIVELERNVETLMKVVNPAGPNTNAKES
jgi:transcriptional regulator with XRE-family HTH domain